MRANAIHDSEENEPPELRLWRAVLANVVREWIHGSLRVKREAEQFLFHDSKDYQTVCFSAGVDPAALRFRLEKIRATTSPQTLAVAPQN